MCCEQREADRIYAFCTSGLGHANVTHEPAEYDHNPYTGITRVLVPEILRCEDCGTDLADYFALNPHLERT